MDITDENMSRKYCPMLLVANRQCRWATINQFCEEWPKASQLWYMYRCLWNYKHLDARNTWIFKDCNGTQERSHCRPFVGRSWWNTSANEIYIDIFIHIDNKIDNKFLWTRSKQLPMWIQHQFQSIFKLTEQPSRLQPSRLQPSQVTGILYRQQYLDLLSRKATPSQFSM